ncbi:MAG: DNA translocase FtsK, partial [Ruminiclostridium sp.]|nr:DNA translocase FtsK [Ruminiclostridium sp.]
KADLQRETEQVARTIEQTMEEGPGEYRFPSLELLTPPSGSAQRAAHEELEGTLSRLGSVLTSFGIDGHVTGAVQGPSVTRYEVALEQGVRLNKLTNLSDDVALALGVSNVRIAPVPGKISVVGVEVPNKVVTPVPIREVLSSDTFSRHKSSAAFSVGKDIGGNYIVGDCAKLPHMLIAGTTGSGKSVCINSLIVSMLYKSTPEELRLIMVDPKMVELGGYNGIPHLLIPVVTDPKKAAGALQWAVTEMMKRYRLFAEAGVRELTSYNQWAQKQEHAEPLPKVVIVIDELADLMLVAAKEVEESICRVAQMGRASGMHLVIATQRPSADVITGLMKANIPSRVAFAVASSLESRIILDTTGAEKLVGKGDMLWFPLGSAKPLRVQGCFISDEEVAAVVDSVKQNSTAEYDSSVMEQIEQHVSESEKKGKGTSGGYPGGEGGEEEQDELFPAAVDVILELGQASVSMLQRRLKLGYARAARLVDQMEQHGIVGPFEGSKPRQLLITKEQWQQMQNGGGQESFADDSSGVEEEIITFDTIPAEYDLG